MSAVPEERASALARAVPLPLPLHEHASRLQLGRAELVLENRRGTYSMLWSDGRNARRYILGLTKHGELSVELRAPRLPVRCAPTDALTLVAGARLRGYLTVPLVPTVVWRDRTAPSRTLVELLPETLQGVWSEEQGHSFRLGVHWMTRFPYPSGQPQVVIPIRVYNRGSDTVSPANIDVQLHDDDLIELRGAIVTRPRRLELGRPATTTPGDQP
jgi:hypothetical protein